MNRLPPVEARVLWEKCAQTFEDLRLCWWESFVSEARDVENFEYAEHAVHEICHALLLGLPLESHLDDKVAARIGKMARRAADVNELEACAVELNVLDVLGIVIPLEAFLNFETIETFDADEARDVVREMRRTERIVRTADDVLSAIRSLGVCSGPCASP